MRASFALEVFQYGDVLELLPAAMEDSPQLFLERLEILFHLLWPSRFLGVGQREVAVSCREVVQAQPHEFLRSVFPVDFLLGERRLFLTRCSPLFLFRAQRHRSEGVVFLLDDISPIQGSPS